MIEAAAQAVGGYSRAHMAYQLFMYGFGVGYRTRQLYRAGNWACQLMAERPLYAPSPQSPWDGGFGYGWRFEPLGKGYGSEETPVERDDSGSR